MKWFTLGRVALLTVITGSCAVALVFHADCSLMRVQSSSMESTLFANDVALIGRCSALAGFRFGTCRSPVVGDIIVFRAPIHSGQVMVKRVAGVEGDRVQLIGGRLKLNGVLCAEPYAKLQFGETWPSPYIFPNGVVVPKNHLFVLGDNRFDSTDSRMWGSIDAGSVMGIVLGALPVSKVFPARSRNAGMHPPEL